MRLKFWVKLATSVVLLVLLIALDGVSALEGLPLLVIALGLALLVGDWLRTWLRTRGRNSLAMLPFMAAALVLMMAYCRGRNLSQAVLFLITLAVVFDVLMISLAVIAETAKRRAKGALEFVGVMAVGVVLGFGVSLIFLLVASHPGGIGLATP
jgi:hypothetical protein